MIFWHNGETYHTSIETPSDSVFLPSANAGAVNIQNGTMKFRKIFDLQEFRTNEVGCTATAVDIFKIELSKIRCATR